MKIKAFFLIFLMMMFGGCASVYQAQVPAGLYVPQTPGVQKIPLKAGVFIADDVESYNKTVDLWSPLSSRSLIFPAGHMFKKAAADAFSQSFSTAVMVKQNEGNEGLDIIITPRIEGLEFGTQVITSPGFSCGKGKVFASLSVGYAVTDNRGNSIFRRSIGVRDVPSKIIDVGCGLSMEEAGGEDAAANAVIALLQESIKALTSSQELLALADSKGFARASGPSPSPDPKGAPVLSDIDELPSVKTAPNKNAYAIVIGIETYRQKLPKADFAVSDAATVKQYLTHMLGYPEENIITLTNEHATYTDLAKYIEEWLPNNLEPNSSVFFYYSGHGAPNPKTGDAFLVPYDGDPNFIEKTGYPLKKLYEQLSMLPAKEIMVALDSCFSGAGGKSVLAEGSRPLVMNMQAAFTPAKNMVVLTASSGSEISSTYKDKGHGLFTYFLLKGVKGEADLNEDGKIEAEELYSYLKPQVQKIARKLYNNEQSPQLIAPNKEIIIR